MKETSLSKSIDKLAQKKAEELLRAIRVAVENALKPYWRHKDANEELSIDDIKSVLNEYVSLLGNYDRNYKVRPSVGLLNNCRARIINDLLNGLPKLNELVAMAEQNEQPDEYQGAGHSDHHQE